MTVKKHHNRKKYVYEPSVRIAEQTAFFLSSIEKILLLGFIAPFTVLCKVPCRAFAKRHISAQRII